MSALGHVTDQKPYIEVKDAILARSGIYEYTLEEVRAKGHDPKTIKPLYKEYRPPAVVAAAAPLFDLVPVPNAEHTTEDITSDNFHDHTSAIVGGPITVVPMPDNINIGLKGRIAFYTKDAHNYYMAGNKETSADYTSKTVLVDNPEEVGYDLLMTEIISVNNVAITQRGRGGKHVRVQDSAPVGDVIGDILNRRNDTMSILTNLLGLDKKEDKPFSATVKDSLLKFKKLSGEESKKEIDGVVSQVVCLEDSPARTTLLGVVRDSYLNADAVLGKWTDTEKLIDGLYSRCKDAEAEAIAAIQDKGGGKGEKEDDDEDDKDGKEGKPKDSAHTSSVQDTAALVNQKFAEITGQLPGMIAEGIKQALAGGAAGVTVESGKIGESQDSAIAESDIDFTEFTLDAFGRSGR